MVALAVSDGSFYSCPLSEQFVFPGIGVGWVGEFRSLWNDNLRLPCHLWLSLFYVLRFVLSASATCLLCGRHTRSWKRAPRWWCRSTGRRLTSCCRTHTSCALCFCLCRGRPAHEANISYGRLSVLRLQTLGLLLFQGQISPLHVVSERLSQRLDISTTTPLSVVCWRHQLNTKPSTLNTGLRLSTLINENKYENCSSRYRLCRSQ